MMFFLVFDITGYNRDVRFSVRKCAKTFLPRKPPGHPVILVHVIGRAGLDVSHQIGQGYVGLQTDQDVRMVRHAMDGDELLALARDNAGNVLVKLFLAFRSNEVLPSLYRKHDLDVDLGVGVSPTSRIRPQKKFFGSPNPSNCWGILHPGSAKRL